MTLLHATYLALSMLLLAGCQAEDSAIWPEQLGFEWSGFNHRLSFLEMGVDEQGVDLAIIGGTSTTLVFPELPEGCDPGTCEEFPALDSATMTVGWARTTTKRAAFGVGEVTLEATAEGVSQTLSIPLGEGGRGEAGAWIQGFSADTDYPLSGGDACYDPANGWHVRRLSVAAESATLSDDGGSVDVKVTARFEAGSPGEEERLCIDAVLDQARVPIAVRVLAAASRRDWVRESVAYEGVYDYGGGRYDPAEQEAPDPDDRPLDLGLDDPMAGWSALDFRFHELDEPGRGAYLRSLYLGVDPVEGRASAYATNYSPGTQLSGFSYQFEGTVTGRDLGEVIERGEVSETVDAELDESGDPVIHRFDL